MMNSQRKTQQRLRSWRLQIRAMSNRTKTRNKFHETRDSWNSQADEILPTASVQDELRTELEAWEAASDEDFEKFDKSLE